ncbi:hypothetical protein [Flavobacterium agrisoli]|uniref:Uncharacterized protein n=1 Tax=Flavobacterium agrisoli TaxID=2793066 RepID=A0A934PKG4_9FLAO|nr:hypothetical protein [Flavobacterium agrisoli]MBK0369806.1 hypothetical protein [Flavobacterium agrisoli]
MVRIINYVKRQTEEGKEFCVLEIQSGVEMVLSSKTNQFYATAKKANITSTFDEVTCKALIGTEMPGTIEKIACQPFEYTIKETGEVITLNHRYRYEPELTQSLKEDQAIQNLLGNENSFSKNGQQNESFVM